MHIIEKANVLYVVFKGGVKTQLQQEWVWGIALAMGLHQGLKYKGSLKSGLLGGFATLAAIVSANGVFNVVSYWDDINAKIFKGGLRNG